MDKLFGYGYQLTPKKALSQPGQFACEECLDIIGPKGELKHVRILGPERSATQIELAQTDCRNIGIKAPVRSSGDTKGTPGGTLRGPNGTLTVPEGGMIALLLLAYTPVLVLVPLLETLGIGEISPMMAAVGMFCLCNWLICKCFVRKK